MAADFVINDVVLSAGVVLAPPLCEAAVGGPGVFEGGRSHEKLFVICTNMQFF